jgi:hypothetical protein
MAKLIMNTRMNIPKSALFLELGWEPVYSFMNRQRVAYYARFQNLADDRLCKVIFNMLRNSENSEYHTYFKKLFIDLGLDHYVQSAIDIEVFRAFYGQSVRQSEFGKVLSKSSLSMYNNCRVSKTGSQPSSKNRADLGMFIIVFIISLAILYCILSKDST